jgi:hypothetical protein
MISRIALPLLALVVTGGCSGSDATAPVSPDVQAVAPALSKSSARSGALHVTKECSQYTRLAGGFCTITSSNLKQIEVGTRVVYAIASGPTVLDTDVILDPPGSGKSTAFGHCRLDLKSGVGLCTFSGGTGKFKHFQASAVVTSLGRPNWAWDGTYSFGDEDDDSDDGDSGNNGQER